ncbi:MAG TPA: response regulator transcription factor [Terriglobales bacterium]|nr:response regulator transcription factor [Terriglobales bacterium]
MNRSRILIADDHNLVAELCRNLLAHDFDVVGTVGNGRAMVRAALQLRPDVIVVDVAMPVLNGLDAGQRVKQMRPAVKLVFLTMHSSPELAAEAFRRGGSAYLLKTCACSELVVAVREVLCGRSYISRTLPRDTLNDRRWRDEEMVEEGARLTARQRQVLQLVAEGRAMKEVGTILKMTARTVAFHKYRIREILGAKSDAELVRYAVRNHLIAA